jgi:hypothetical protein
VLKKNLAQIILASACTGNREVEQLKEVALRGVSKRAELRYKARQSPLICSCS